MANTIPLPIGVQVVDRSATKAVVVPWYIWCCLASVVFALIGIEWDISWHKSIGRDSFWTPAHVLIYLSGILAGITCGYLILSTTFQKRSPLRDVSISMWGFRGPLGAFICSWGGLAMIASAPFDNWWHNSYGLDVKILSPPHVLLALGMAGIRFGTLVMILAEMNRAQGENRARLERLMFFAAACLMSMIIGIVQEDTNRVLMHGSQFYMILMFAAPISVAMVAWVSDNPWSATIVTTISSLIQLALVWILPLFPAEPKLGPVYQPITHFVPPDFPLLLIVPAIVFDLLRRKMDGWNRWMQALTLGGAYLVSFTAAQWPFANFLMSPASRNRIFATNNYPYAVPPMSPWVRNVFVATEHGPGQFWMRMVIAFMAAFLMTRIGMGWGDWMRRIRR